MSPRSIADLLRAAEPGPQPLGGLIDRLGTLGVLRGARSERRAIGAAALAHRLVATIAYDSRRVRPGSLFVAVPGQRVDGHDFVASAAEAGATAAIVERPLAELAIPQLVVADARAALAHAASWWYRDPSDSLAVVGVTGTDGKTTTSTLALAVLEASGRPTGLTGTIETKIDGVRESHAEHATTPEAPELQADLRAMVDNGDTGVVIETTSHGLALHRVTGISYDIAVFTNLSHEHLELHGTFERYRAAKLSLFEKLARRGRTKPGAPRAGVVNRDDPNADVFEAVVREAGARLITYGTDPSADVRAERVEEDARHLRVHLVAPSWRGVISLRLAGRFNAHNALAAWAVGEAFDLEPDAIRAGLESVSGVAGRMERVDAGQSFGVIVDFAHSPAALEKVLDVLAPLAAAQGGGLIVVFGSAGDRDTAKRPLMGRVAGERARLVVLADEDPRTEDPMAILDEIARGAEAVGRRRGRDLLLIPDRSRAIATAFERARPGDIVVLAGKGHEQSIEVAGRNVPWNERAAAEAALAALGHIGEPEMADHEPLLR
jgi:UDP-N-acetylmuramoyl-L-alanyl-D-glutamate--2,6-diaminopimelate ligase